MHFEPLTTTCKRTRPIALGGVGTCKGNLFPGNTRSDVDGSMRSNTNWRPRNAVYVFFMYAWTSIHCDVSYIVFQYGKCSRDRMHAVGGSQPESTASLDGTCPNTGRVDFCNASSARRNIAVSLYLRSRCILLYPLCLLCSRPAP